MKPVGLFPGAKKLTRKDIRTLRERSRKFMAFSDALRIGIGSGLHTREEILRMEDCMFKHDLGVEVESKVSKTKGIIVSRSECLYGCNRYYVQPKVNKDMKVPDGWWIDEDELIVKGKGVTAKPKNTGGMMDRIR